MSDSGDVQVTGVSRSTETSFRIAVAGAPPMSHPHGPILPDTVFHRERDGKVQQTSVWGRVLLNDGTPSTLGAELHLRDERPEWVDEVLAAARAGEAQDVIEKAEAFLDSIGEITVGEKLQALQAAIHARRGA